MITLRNTPNRIINEWDYTILVNKDGVAIGISNDFNPRKYLLEDKVSFTNHHLVRDDEVGVIKKIIFPSRSDKEKRVLEIECRDIKIFAALEEVVKR